MRGTSEGGKLKAGLVIHLDEKKKKNKQEIEKREKTLGISGKK